MEKKIEINDFRVVRFDHPGHGRSPIPDAPVTVESLADGVVELLDTLELERASFCGLSLGGMVGMALGLRAPERLVAPVGARAAPAISVGARDERCTG